MGINIEAELRRLQTQADGFFASLNYARPGQQYETGAGPLLTVSRVGYGDAELDRVLDGTADAEVVILTEDGRVAITSEWHSGSSERAVYTERWEAGRGRMFHGWVDADSRKLVQAG